MTAELAQWAQIIFVMEKAHRTRLIRRFGAHLRHARVVCRDIPDTYGFMDAALVRLLEARCWGGWGPEPTGEAELGE